jgi:hypothetical protein
MVIISTMVVSPISTTAASSNIVLVYRMTFEY